MANSNSNTQTPAQIKAAKLKASKAKAAKAKAEKEELEALKATVTTTTVVSAAKLKEGFTAAFNSWDTTEITGVMEDKASPILTDKTFKDANIALALKGSNVYLSDITVEIVSYSPAKESIGKAASWNTTNLEFTLKAGTSVLDGCKSLAGFIRNAMKKDVKSKGLRINPNAINIELALIAQTSPLTAELKVKRSALLALQKSFTKNFGALSLAFNGQIYGGAEMHKGNAVASPERLYSILMLMFSKTQVEQEAFDAQFMDVVPVEPTKDETTDEATETIEPTV